jgi:hypothetical protein
VADTLRQQLNEGGLKKAKCDSRRLSLFDAAYRWNAGPRNFVLQLSGETDRSIARWPRIERDLETLNASRSPLELPKQGFPFSILIHSRTDTRGFANAKFEPEFEPVGPFHYAATDQLCLALA